MRKTWVKRDNIYYKPFYKQKLKMTLLGVLLMAIVFFGYQLFYIRSQPAEEESPAAANVRDAGGGAGDDTVLNGSSRSVRGPSQDQRYVYVERVGSYEKKILRGIRLRDLDQYSERPGTQFRCQMAPNRVIDWDRVNDDYCDCPEDGSDEPSTNACAQGRFYCRFQKRHHTGRGSYTSIPSAWTNDGVCDCCDGSDEWLTGSGGAIVCRNRCQEMYPY
ncbi:uncharacterized protein LOC129756672 isoform X2 [Uranotaenia lowii]|uniref:uncharacterized protein LOC129756672 isoform X2 n=1 Tax=Uranotaenia lowii TaxID=190385 RepID=UPI0024784AC8|nr:uncharacterized protein LOC129756672 isoform X2 [Uranotaenia lowii]